MGTGGTSPSSSPTIWLVKYIISDLLCLVFQKDVPSKLCIDRAAQQIADLFSVHVSALPLASVLLVKHTAPADQMQELWTKKAKRKRSKISLRAFWSSRRLPIFTSRFQLTILGTSELNCCVRNGNRWNLTVIVTDHMTSQVYHFWSTLSSVSEGRAFKTE